MKKNVVVFLLLLLVTVFISLGSAQGGIPQVQVPVSGSIPGALHGSEGIADADSAPGTSGGGTIEGAVGCYLWTHGGMADTGTPAQVVKGGLTPAGRVFTVKPGYGKVRVPLVSFDYDGTAALRIHQINVIGKMSHPSLKITRTSLYTEGTLKWSSTVPVSSTTRIEYSRSGPLDWLGKNAMVELVLQNTGTVNRQFTLEGVGVQHL